MLPKKASRAFWSAASIILSSCFTSSYVAEAKSSFFPLCLNHIRLCSKGGVPRTATPPSTALGHLLPLPRNLLQEARDLHFWHHSFLVLAPPTHCRILECFQVPPLDEADN